MNERLRIKAHPGWFAVGAILGALGIQSPGRVQNPPAPPVVQGQVVQNPQPGQTTGTAGQTTGAVAQTTGAVAQTTGAVAQTTGTAHPTTGVFGQNTGAIGPTTGTVGETGNSQDPTSPAEGQPALTPEQIELLQIQAALAGTRPPANAIWADSLDVRNMIQKGEVVSHAGRSSDGRPITLSGVVYPHGIGTHANSSMPVDIKGGAVRFRSIVGVDDEVPFGKGNIVFSVIVDGKKVADSGPMRSGDPPRLLDVDLTGAQRMTLSCDAYAYDTGNGHGDWAGAVIVLTPGFPSWPQSLGPNTAAPQVAMPPAPDENTVPAVHGAPVVGASPHRPFLYLIAASGKGPLTYAATPLPKGLSLDAHTGIITGQFLQPGTYPIHVTVSGPGGKAGRILTLVCGDHKLALTPPMGWNAWNVYGETVTAAKIRQQARWLVKSGLAAHGYQYIIIDDTWQGRRDDAGQISPSLRFGDMPALAHYVHSLGLKLGLLSAASEHTCSGYAGSAGHELQDAKAFASWGIDYLKYDWCQQNETRTQVNPNEVLANYAKMRTALDKVNRDIVFAATPYGMGSVWDAGADLGVNTWACNAGILDKWESIEQDGFGQIDRARSSRPSHWNDLGSLMIGRLGSSNPHFPHLRMEEQVAHLSLWSLMASPLILSCDLTQLNPNNFYPSTTALLTNDEVIDIDQDALGQPAHRVGLGDNSVVLARPLADGSFAVGLFNNQWWAQNVTVRWAALGLSGTQPVRDLWQHKDLGNIPDSFTVSVPRHGVVLLKVGKQHAKREGEMTASLPR